MDPMQQQAIIQNSHNEADALRAVQQASMRTPTARAESQERRAILTRTVEAAVIPELLALHRAPLAVTHAPVLVVEAADVARLVDLVLAHDEPAALAFVSDMHDRGAAHEALCLDLLAPTARRLGEMWDSDDCDFTEVSIGLWRLQAALRALGNVSQASGARPAGARVLLVPLPGEQHTFGLSMVHDFFARAGWDSWTGPVETSAELATMVRSHWVSMLGFSLPCDEQLDAVRSEIRRVRSASRNPNIAIMVGGPGFSADPTLAAQVGADGTATDGRQAVLQAALLVTNGMRR